MNSITAVVLILGFTLLSGFNDGGNLLATFVNTRVMNVRITILMILAALVAGPLLIGTRVARTIGVQIINVHQVEISTLNIALFGTLVTLLFCWKWKVPTSTSFALVGGMIGATLSRFGMKTIIWGGLVKVLTSLLLAVIFGSLVGFLTYTLMLILLRHSSIRIGIGLGKLQYISALAVCFGYGANDAEKSIGLLATVQMISTKSSTFHVFTWMIFLTTFVFGIGLLVGGWRIAKTIGFHVFRARPTHSLATQLASAVVVLTASSVGGPVSSTQTIDSALIGVGIRACKERVRWSVVRKLGLVWVTTMPLAFVVSYLVGLITDIGGVLR